jgi:hypothetical protein
VVPFALRASAPPHFHVRAMSSESSYFAKRYRDFDTDELLRLYESGLSEVAEAVAISELQSRGVEIPNKRQPVDAETESYEGDFVTVARYLVPTEAHLLQGCLRAAGIPAIVTDAGLVQANAFLALAVGGVRVLVPQAHVTDAREVIRALNRGDLALKDDVDAEGL